MPDLTPGRWAVVGAFGHRFKPDIMTVQRSSPGYVYLLTPGGNEKRLAHAAVMATYETRDEAIALRDRIAGIYGEVTRRQRAASDWGNKALDHLLSTVND